ncbi:MAG: Arm DNA-binding domain-containing protein [Alphaproteobacteria bacterium]
MSHKPVESQHALTGVDLAALTPGRYIDGGGLQLVVRSVGSRRWIFRYSVKNRKRDVQLGSANPEGVNIEDARTRAAELLTKVRSGIDPLEERKTEMARTLDVFPCVIEQHEGQMVKHRNIVCDDCGFTSRIREKGGPSLPIEMLTKKFQSYGWRVGPPHTCPKCQSAKSKPAPHVVAALPQQKEPAMTAEQPKQPTIEQRRKIRDALDEHYLEDAGCYRAAFSDKSLAAKLEFPAKWVADLREANGYGPDANENARKANAAIDLLERRLTEMENRHLEDLDAIRKEINRLKIDRAYA